MRGTTPNDLRETASVGIDVFAGAVENPKEDTWQVLGKLVQNAFFKAILPGFEKTVPADNCHVNDRSVFLLILCR